MTLPDYKVRQEHLSRMACVYLRQSTVVQVQEHQESTRRQYALVQRARLLGWPDARIQVIDEDLGHSASDVAHPRTGFQKLLARVVTGEVGAIFSVEVSRLARQDSEGHRLVEVAALTDTLLLDEQQAYDPCLADDRLILGLKVLLSSNELRLMHQRLRENLLSKARRGELRLNLPVGLVFVPHNGIQLDPDEQVQGAVRLLFDRFRLSGRMSEVARYFQDNGLRFPRRRGSWHGELEWAPLSLDRIRAVLANPLYAGAYVYGRTKRQTLMRSEQHIERPRRRLPIEEWTVAQWEAFPGYIDRAEYEANQARLAQNRANPHIPSRGREVLEEGVHRVVRKPVLSSERFDAPAVQTTEAAPVGPHPEVSVLVLAEGADVLLRETRIFPDTREAPVFQAAQAACLGADPQGAVPPHEEAPHAVPLQRCGLRRRFESPGPHPEETGPAGADP